MPEIRLLNDLTGDSIPMKIRMLALAAGISLAAFSNAGAAMTPVKHWANDPMQVTQWNLGSGHQVCAFVVPSIEVFSFMLGQDDDGQIFFSLAYGGQWTKGPTMTLTVDNGTPFNLAMSVIDDGAAISGTIPNEGAGRDFLHALYNGKKLKVQGGLVRSFFSLQDAATAINIMHRCADAIMAEKQGRSLPPQVATTPNGASPQPQVGTTPSAPPEVATTAPATEVAFERDGGGMVIVPVSLNGAPSVKFLLDSGATGVQIPYGMLTWLMDKGLVTPSDYRGMQEYVLADGSKHKNESYLLHSITLGGRVVTDVVVAIGPDNSAPLLGESVLEKFGSVTFDYQRNVLRLGTPTQGGVSDVATVAPWPVP